MVEHAPGRSSSPTGNGLPGFKPLDLDRFPAVDQLLVARGFGPFVRDSLTAPVGRNDVWAGVTTSGATVFVKRLVGSDEDVRARMRRLLSFERFSARIPSGRLRWPSFLCSDEDAGLVVFDHLDGTKNGAELMVDEIFDDALAETAGQIIGELHATRPTRLSDLDNSLPAQPSPELLRGLPVRMFEALSFAELEAWRLMQHDEPLVRAVEDLRWREWDAPKVPVHCDLRVDQFLVSGEDVYVTDWEEFRLGDPARDVGSFAGEWLYRSVLDIVTARGDTNFVDTTLTHDLVIQRGVEKLERLVPRIRNFWKGYRDFRPYVDTGFTERATAFAGWHLLDRLLTGAARASRLSGIERAAAGIGRAALLTPGHFVGVLGFEESR